MSTPSPLDMSHSTTSILQLPTEMLDEIAGYVSLRTDLAALCLVSKLFNALSTVHLYQIIFNHQPTKIIQCCRTLVTNSAAARAVRTFIIFWSVLHLDHLYRLNRRIPAANLHIGLHSTAFYIQL
jgi:hypothetical protein